MINISIVLYNTSKDDINNFLSSIKLIEKNYTLYIIDNSPKNSLEVYFLEEPNVIYIHNKINLGFGAAHNVALKETLKNNIPYHFVVNPDSYFLEDVVSSMVEFMETNSDIGMMMPQVLNLDGSVQQLPKLLPSPFSLVMRKLKWPSNLYKKFINKYELRFVNSDAFYQAPIISGCFTVFRTAALEKIGIYDERFFLYFEDWDISRRMHQEFRTIYFPKISIYHGYESGANKSAKLLKLFLKSGIKYFNKWGWFFDSERRIFNNSTLKQFQ